MTQTSFWLNIDYLFPGILITTFIFLFKFRNSCSLKTSQNPQKNTCARASFLIKLQAFSPQNYYKWDSSTNSFLWILHNVYKHLFCRKPRRTAAADSSEFQLHFFSTLYNVSKVANSLFSGLTLNAFFQWCVIRQSYSDFSDMFIYQIYYLIKYIYIYISISIYRER